MGLPFRNGGATHTAFPSHFPVYPVGTLPPPTVHRGFIWAELGWSADPLLLTNKVASARFTSQCFHFLVLNTCSIVFNSPLCHSIFLDASGWQGMWYTQSMLCFSAQESMRLFWKWVLMFDSVLSGLWCCHRTWFLGPKMVFWAAEWFIGYVSSQLAVVPTTHHAYLGGFVSMILL